MEADHRIDTKISKRVYPRENNDSALTFIFDSDPNLCLEKNKIQIGFTVEIPENYIPENGFCSKLFSSLGIEINSQLISSNRIRNEYPLIDKLSKIGYFEAPYFTKAFLTEGLYSYSSRKFRLLSRKFFQGYFDQYCYSATTDETNKEALIKHRRKYLSPKNKKYKYEFIIVPNHGFLNTCQPLPPGTELKLTFERATAEHSLIKIKADSSLSGKVLSITNAFATASYKSSPYLRNYFGQIETTPIPYEYEEMQVVSKNIIPNTQIIRLDNVYGGNIPELIFVGIVPASNLNGNFAKTSTVFKQNDICEVNISLNGSACQGYPIKINDEYPIWGYQKFLETTKRTYNPACADVMALEQYLLNCVYGNNRSHWSF